MDKRHSMIIGVLTAKSYLARQEGVLATWGRDALARGDVDVVFLIGDPSLKMPRREGSMLYLPCPDDYASLPRKTRWFCLWALAQGGDWRWLFKCDDDTYLRVDRLLDTNWTGPVVGCKDGDGEHWHGGAGYLINREAAAAIAMRLQASTGLEDQEARNALRGSGMWFQHDSRFCFDKSRMPLPRNNGITCHYCSPVRMRLIHDDFRFEHPASDVRIPKVLHHIWLGGQPIAERLAAFRQSWAALHPAWEMKLWTEANMPPLANQSLFNAAPTPAQKSHIARYEILHREGGVYVDFDVECRRPIDDLLYGLTGFAAAEDDDAVGVAVLGAMPDDELLARVIAAIPGSMTRSTDLPRQTGSWFLTEQLLAADSWRLYWWDKFYPKHWSGRIEASLERAHAIHHWEASWNR